MKRRLLIDLSLVADGGSRTYAHGFIDGLTQTVLPPLPPDVEVFVLLSRQELSSEADRLGAVGCTPLLVEAPKAGTWSSRAAQQWLLPMWARRVGATDLFVPRETAPQVYGDRMALLAHNLLFWEASSGPLPASQKATIALGRLLAHRAVRKARCVIAPSRWLASHLPRGDVAVVPHGSDIELGTVGEKEQCWMVGSRRLEVVAIGTVYRHKHFERSIEIAGALARSGLEVRLSIWGGAPDQRLLAGLRAGALTALGYDPFRGPLAFDQRAELFRRSDVLIFSSTRESFGFPLIEALRTSTVVLGPASPLVRELCQGAAVLFDEGDPKAGAAEITAALSRLRAIAAAGLIIGESYSWGSCVERTIRAILGAGDEFGSRTDGSVYTT